MKQKLSSIFLLLQLFLNSSCGYNWNQELSQNDKPSIYVPYIDGDEDGSFTAELIRTITSLGIANVSKGSPDFELKVQILDNGVNTIGYRWDKQKVSGELTDNIVACEARRSIKAEFFLINTSSCEKIGPYLVEADSEFDYVDGDCIHDLTFRNSYGIKTLVLPFSLGQLEPQEAAREATTKPLYRKLSQKIADALFTNM